LRAFPGAWIAEPEPADGELPPELAEAIAVEMAAPASPPPPDLDASEAEAAAGERESALERVEEPAEPGPHLGGPAVAWRPDAKNADGVGEPDETGVIDGSSSGAATAGAPNSQHSASPAAPADLQEPENSPALGSPAASSSEEPGASDAGSEPLLIGPRPPRRRGLSFRRRKLDARQLREVAAPFALRAMVAEIDPLWTAGETVDIVIALRDGSALAVRGGSGAAVVVHDAEADEPADARLVMDSHQVVQLLGRLICPVGDHVMELHGDRTQVDALVGWLDRAQRLQPQPL